ncbi:hypothetical protein ZWY2020_036823 [Hordeum vulgare]|nr:hypothetical protein ZWY2020_036823 [Hordeum vulgare]
MRYPVSLLPQMDALPSQPSDGRSKWNGLCGSLVLIQLEGLSGLKIIELLYLNVYNRLLNSCGIKLESPTNDFACPSLQFTMSSFGAWRQTRAGERERERRRKRELGSIRFYSYSLSPPSCNFAYSIYNRLTWLSLVLYTRLKCNNSGQKDQPIDPSGSQPAIVPAGLIPVSPPSKRDLKRVKSNEGREGNPTAAKTTLAGLMSLL